MSRIPNTALTVCIAVVLALGGAAEGEGATITFTGSRDYSGGQPGVPNPARCGTPAPGTPPLLLITHPTGAGLSNLGAFSSTESHCTNVGTGTLYNGLFTFDFGSGNTLSGLYGGTVVGLPPPPIPVGTILNATFNYTPTSGTGLFLNPGGSLVGIGTATFTVSGINSHIDIAGTITTVPEPGTVTLLAAGLAGIRIARRRLRSGSSFRWRARASAFAKATADRPAGQLVRG